MLPNSILTPCTESLHLTEMSQIGFSYFFFFLIVLVINTLHHRNNFYLFYTNGEPGAQRIEVAGSISHY